MEKRIRPQLADLALGKLKKKRPELKKALEGQVDEHHRVLLRELLDELDCLERDRPGFPTN